MLLSSASVPWTAVGLRQGGPLPVLLPLSAAVVPGAIGFHPGMTAWHLLHHPPDLSSFQS
eukprot:5461500-Pyramimonas_sp.AAC.1